MEVSRTEQDEWQYNDKEDTFGHMEVIEIQKDVRKSQVEVARQDNIRR